MSTFDELKAMEADLKQKQDQIDLQQQALENNKKAADALRETLGRRKQVDDLGEIMQILSEHVKSVDVTRPILVTSAEESDSLGFDIRIRGKKYGRVYVLLQK